MSEIYIEKGALNQLEAHALRDFPNECCGFLFGKNGEITEAQAVENSKEGDKRRRFEISPLDYMKAEKKALALNQDLIGIYHSHPLHPAVPSEHDLALAQPGFSYLISSVTEEKVETTRSWKLNQQLQFEEESLIITQSTI